jgi:hypothetical protein
VGPDAPWTSFSALSLRAARHDKFAGSDAIIEVAAQLAGRHRHADRHRSTGCGDSFDKAEIRAGEMDAMEQLQPLSQLALDLLMQERGAREDPAIRSRAFERARAWLESVSKHPTEMEPAANP